MITIKGKSVFGGVSIGKIMFYKRNEKVIKRTHVDDVDAEWKRFCDAKDTAVSQLKELYDKAIEDVGEANAMIFEIHQMMLEDLDYLESIENIIRTQEVNAEFAVATTADNFAQMFAAMDDAYMQGRAADVKDVSERVLDILCGVSGGMKEMTEPCIIAADDLAPSETVQLDKSKVLGFATMYGSSNSHTAILARTMNIPAVIGLGEDLLTKYDGKMAVIDGFTGMLYIDPDEETMKVMEEKRAKDQEQKALLEQLKGKENVTKSGQKINVYANIGNVSDVGAVLKNDAGGIGLFRSEFLYLENSDFPTEEQQFAVYKQVAENMAGKKVIIRTLDIGADKQVDYFGLDKEENPALGYRAIRICLTRKEIFKTQLRALYRAAMFGNISIMFPMIISVAEVHEIKAIIAEVKEELKNEGIPFKDDVELGVMIETPASVMISRELAKEVDFFSVGTNDLTQYTLAIDRQNAKLDKFYDPHHPAVLAMIKMAADNAHAEGAWIGICGELGADLELTEEFLKDHISLSYAYGDGGYESCELAENAVSELLYGLPIDGYCALNMDGLPVLTDSVGGVTVTVPNDSLAEVDPGYAKGAVVTLKGEDTEQFVRYRNTEISQSAIARMERQQEYIRAFGEALKKASADKALVTDLYKAIEPYMVTNMGKSRFVDLTESVSEGKKVNRWTIPGEGIQGKEYDEYVVDDDALYEKTVETFYVEKK